MPALDPTRTIGLRRKFLVDMTRRFTRLGVAIVQLVEKEDAFGLNRNQPSAASRFTGNTRYAFMTDENKVTAFQEWLMLRTDLEILGTEGGTNPDAPWLSEYIESAYKQGVTRAYVDSQGAMMDQPAGFVEGSKAEFLRSTFGSAQTTESLKRLYSRTFESLKGVDAVMATTMSRVLADGLAHGKGPRDIARELKKETGISTMRAQRIARTEIIYAYAEGQLDSFQKLGVEEVGVLSEWLTAGDNRVCPRCAGNEGKTFSIKEARGMIPLHPNCRCAWVPHVPLSPKIQKLLDKGKAQAPAPAGSIQAPAPTLFGEQPTAVARWMGKEGWSFEDAKRVMNDRGVNISDATLKTQLNAGKKGLRGEPSKLTDEQRTELYASKAGKKADPVPPPPPPPKPDPTPPPPPPPKPDPVPPPPKPDPVPPPKPGPVEPTAEELASFRSQSGTALARLLGKEGFSKAEARKVLDQLGIEVKDSTLGTQLNAGRKGERGAPANVTDRQREILLRLRGGAGGPIAPPKPTPTPLPKPIKSAGDIPKPVVPEKVKKDAWVTFTGTVDANDPYSVFGESVRKMLDDNAAAESKLTGYATRMGIGHERQAVEIGRTVAGFVDARVAEYTKKAAEQMAVTGQPTTWKKVVYKEIDAAYKDYLQKKSESMNIPLKDVPAALAKKGDAKFHEMEHYLGALGDWRIARAWINKRTLSSIRDFGIPAGGDFDWTAASTETKKSMKIAARMMPRDWIQTFGSETAKEKAKEAKAHEKAAALGKKSSYVASPLNPKRYTIKVIDTKRGYFDPNSNTIALSGRGRDLTSTAVHELTHLAERDRLGLTAREREFYERRTAGMTATTIFGDEKGIKDDFMHHYMGKAYGGRFFELLTMGCEEVLCGGGGHDTPMSEGDRDMLHFIIGMLAGG